MTLFLDGAGTEEIIIPSSTVGVIRMQYIISKDGAFGNASGGERVYLFENFTPTVLLTTTNVGSLVAGVAGALAVTVIATNTLRITVTPSVPDALHLFCFTTVVIQTRN